jgi:carboxymethylenebutenolidase
MAEQRVEIRIDDTVAPAFVYGLPKSPSVLMYIDGLGMRPAIRAVAERVAGLGYRVLLPDLFWRMGPYIAPDPHVLFADATVRADWFDRARGAASQAQIMSDTRAYLDQLAGKVAVVGYCLGGQMAIVAAGTYPDRVVAAAAYHPGDLATKGNDSPHRLAPNMKASVYVGAAMDDPSFPPAQIDTFGDALRTAHVDHVIETYQARHGWVPSDTPAHDPAAAEKHFQTLGALLQRTLS